MIGSAAEVVDPNARIDKFADFAYYVIGERGDAMSTRAVGVIEMPDGSWTVSVPAGVREEIRGHLVATYLKHYILGESIGGVLLAAAQKLNKDYRDELLLASDSSFSAAHHLLAHADPIELLRQSGVPLATSLRELRVGNGQVFDKLPEVRRFNHALFRGQHIDLPRAKVKLALGESARTSVPLGDDFVQTLSLTREPGRSAKPHICRSCQSAIVASSPRLTLGTIPRGGFDHHHVHAFCGS